MTEHPGVDSITFTGETTTGNDDHSRRRRDAQRNLDGAGRQGRRVVFADADLDVAVAQTIRSTLLNQGEVCLATPRLLVQRPIFDEFCKRYQAAAEALVFGDPLDEATSIGSLVHSSHFDSVVKLHRDREERGREAALRRREAERWRRRSTRARSCKPTAFVGVQQQDADLPGRSLRTGRDDRAVRHRRRRRSALANDVKYGLGERDLHDAICSARTAWRGAIRAGLVWVNCWFVRDLRTPFGGMKESGIGREGGRYSLEFYSELKNICIAL